jgi:hypothetical protein
MLLADNYPIPGIFWPMLMFMGIVLMLGLIIWCVVDNLRRHGHHGRAKLGWTVLILFPILGAFIDVVARPARVE